LEEKSYHFSPEMIARLFSVPHEKKGSEAGKPDAVTTFINKNILIEKPGPPNRKLEPERIPNEKKSIAPQKDSENYYPTRGVVTVGILMTVVGLLIFSPISLPSIYRFVGGTGFFIMGISVIGAGLINSRKIREATLEQG
jgi:hypothetical protein